MCGPMYINIVLGNSWERFKDLLAASVPVPNQLIAGKGVDGRQYPFGAYATDSVQAGATDNRRAGFGQDLNVFPYRVPLDVHQLQFHPVIERQVPTAVYLHRTG